MAENNESRRQRCERRLTQLKSARQSWEGDWRDLAWYFQPRRFRLMAGDTNGARESKRHAIIDNTTTDSVDVLASGMMAGITSPARPWFKFEVPDPELNDNADVKKWTHECERRVMAAISRSNIYPVLHTMYADLGCFGTACALVVEDDEDDIRAIQMAMNTYYLAEDHRNTIDTMYREFKRSVRQLVQEFGIDNVTRATAERYNRGNDCLDEMVTVVHAIERNDEAKPGREDNANMEFRSVYYECDSKDDVGQVLRESGFRENPILAPRWQVMAGDSYGTSPGYKAMPDGKSLQWHHNEKAKALSKIVNPPMNAPSSMRNDSKSLNPGAINYYDPTGPGAQGMTPVYQINFRLNELQGEIEDTRQRIRTAFFVDLFKMLTLDNKTDRTAREIQERHEEKLLMLGPVLERVQNDLLSPMLDRVFGILMRKGKLPEPPPELEGTELRIEYISMLAQAQKMAGISAIERFLGFSGKIAGVNPGVLDKIDFDRAIDQYAEAVGIAPSIIRDSEEVQRIRQQRAEAEQQQQAAEQMNQAAEGAELLSRADTGGSNLLSQMMGG